VGEYTLVRRSVPSADCHQTGRCSTICSPKKQAAKPG
jgi:hypothetical protein